MAKKTKKATKPNPVPKTPIYFNAETLAGGMIEKVEVNAYGGTVLDIILTVDGERFSISASECHFDQYSASPCLSLTKV